MKKQVEMMSAEELAAKRMKKKILIVLVAVVGGLLLLFLAVQLAQGILEKNKWNSNQKEYEFYPTYNGDIMQYGAYLDLNRTVSYCNDPSGYGVTMSITDENRQDFNANVLYLFDFVQVMIAGDTAAYNACFHDSYYEDHEKQEAFSPQMLYNIKIFYHSSEDTSDGAKRYTYRLEYMLFENDGTLRRDVGSDAIRPQYVSLRVEVDGTISIEDLITSKTQYLK